MLVVMNDEIHGAHSLTKMSDGSRLRSCHRSAASWASFTTGRWTTTTIRRGNTPSRQFDVSKVTKLPRGCGVSAGHVTRPDYVGRCERRQGIVIAGWVTAT